MQRVLTILLSLALVTTAAAAPAFACMRDTAAVGSQDHGCCTEQIVAPASAATCCVVSQPAGDRALIVWRVVRSNGRHADLAPFGTVAAFPGFREGLHRPLVGIPSPAARAVPTYLRHLALLI